MITGSFDETEVINYQQPYYGWNRPSSNEYHTTHVSTTAVPIVPVAFYSSGFPQYPNQGRMMFNNSYECEAPHRINSQHHHQQHHHHAPPAHKGKVHFAEHDTVTEVVDHKNGRREVHQESIDAEADGYIRLKHKNFELAKWETFKG